MGKLIGRYTLRLGPIAGVSIYLDTYGIELQCIDDIGSVVDVRLTKKKAAKIAKGLNDIIQLANQTEGTKP